MTDDLATRVLAAIERKPGPEDDIFASMGAWDAACTEHAAVVRSHNEVAEMWSLPRRTES